MAPSAAPPAAAYPPPSTPPGYAATPGQFPKTSTYAVVSLVLAIGYEDNCILLCRLTDAAELLVRVPVKGQGSITALAWDTIGKKLVFGTSEGAAGLLTLP